MEKFLALSVSGAVSGAVYSLLAIGLVLTYSTSGVFNFAHGAVAFTTAFVFYELNTGLGWPVWLAAIVSIVLFAPLLGLLLDKAIFRRLSQASQSARIVATVGMMIAIPSIALWVVDVLIRTFDVDIPTGDNIFSPRGLGPVPKKVWSIGDQIRIDSNQVVALVAAAVAALALWLLVNHTRVGLQMRAAVQRPDLAETRGVNTDRVSGASWALGFGLAGLAGVVGAPFFSLTPSTYTTVLFVAATAAVLGGLRSLPLAFAGGIVLGLAQSLIAGYATFASSITGFSTAVPFAFLFLGLLVLNRERGRVAGQVAEDELPPDHHGDLSTLRRVVPWAVASVAFLVYLFFVADVYWQGLLTKGLAYSIIFLSFTIVIGAGGMVSLAQAGFVTLAALVTGLMLSHDVPFVVAVIIGVAAAAVAGALVALPSIRLGGLALALATLALALIGDRVLFAWDKLGNSSTGWKIPRPELGVVDLHDQRSLAVTFIVVFGVLAVVVRNLQRSRTWRSIVAVRSAPPAATAVGISLTSTRLLVFSLSAAVAGLGGVMLCTYNTSITNATFPATTGLVWLAIVVLFGTRRVEGALVAGIVFAISPDVIGWFTDSTRVANILFGLGAVQLAKSPDGILSSVSAANHLRRQRRRTRGDRARVTPAEPRRAAAAGSVEPSGDSSVDGSVGEDLPLVLHDVRAGYGGVEVLHGIDLSVRPGTIVALFGPNGSGKSTLCKVVAGLLPVTGGELRTDGEVVSAQLGHRRARRGVGYAPESRGVFPALTVDENLALTLRSTFERDAVYDRFPSLADRRRLLASNLSGGEQQMLTLAPFLVRPPDVLVADEPSLGLAPLVVEQITGFLRELRDGGTAVLVVEEKAGHMLSIADEIAFLDLGRVAWSSPARDVAYEDLAAAYLTRGGAR
jgi:branched-subunit amino acid ABC-type transport system permease component/ABC-type branched-subunit amino acid transport system ATPase component